ncbi:MAG: glucose-1-phosphate adenylyltransferase [Anaerolineaceae bacterium]|nr:glucose-1-phosphate adenylyltransferase [Anaerolineaceae bacterium]
MKTRAVILAGGEGSRLGTLTAKRTKPAVPFAGKYRIIDFTLSNCVNSGLFDVMIIAQYRPHSLLEHIGAGGPWDLNRDFTGGVRIYTPYKARRFSDWFSGTADAIQQNFSFVKHNLPDLVMILSGDHIYAMDYDALVVFHTDHQADMTMATIAVPRKDASRFGVVEVGNDYRVTSFVEKPADPTSNMANMGVYVFNLELLDRVLWEDHLRKDSSHDFGKDIIPALIKEGARIYAYPYTGYWVDVGTVNSYWQAHMDLLTDSPSFDLNDRTWIIHTRTEERPPAFVAKGAIVENSMLSGGCVICQGAKVIRSVLSPGVMINNDVIVQDSILLTDSVIKEGSVIQRAILDKRVIVGAGAQIGGMTSEEEVVISMVGKASVLPPGIILQPGAAVGPDVVPADFLENTVKTGQYIQTRRLPYEV